MGSCAGPYRRLIDDSGHIALLEGQRFVVVRPTDAVSDIYDEVRAQIRARCAGLSVSYPAEAHVTLAGLPKGTATGTVRELVTEWAPTVPRLRLEVEKLSCFPAPFQVVILQVRKTPDLFHALSSLRERLEQRQLRDLAAVAPADWVFHMSVAYCSSLSPSQWTEVARFVDTVDTRPEQCLVEEAEVVAFDGGQEHSVCVSRLTGNAASGSAGRD